MGDNTFSVPALRDMIEGRVPPSTVRQFRIGEKGPGSVELDIWPQLDPWCLAVLRRWHAGWLEGFRNVHQVRGSVTVRVSEAGAKVLACTLPLGRTREAVVQALMHDASGDHYDLRAHVARWQLDRRTRELEAHLATFLRDVPDIRPRGCVEFHSYASGQDEELLVDLRRPLSAPDITCVPMSGADGPKLVVLSPESYCRARGGLFHEIFASQVIEALDLQGRARVVPAPRVLGPNGQHSFVLPR